MALGDTFLNERLRGRWVDLILFVSIRALHCDWLNSRFYPDSAVPVDAP